MRQSKAQVSRVLILAGDADHNLGDSAILVAICDLLRSFDPKIAISAISAKCSHEHWDAILPDLRTIRPGPAGMLDLLRTARAADLVICGGGGLFQDDDSLVKMPYWALRLLTVRMATRRIAGVSIGAGPLHHGVSRLFARLALAMLNPISVRDPMAKATVKPLTRREVRVVPDPAFALRTADGDTARSVLQSASVPRDGQPLVGVALRRWFHMDSNLIPHKWAERYRLRSIPGDEQMQVLRDLVASVLDTIVDEYGCHIVFMPSYDVAHEADGDVCQAVARTMRTGAHSHLRITDPRIFKAVAKKMNVFLAGRMHPAILASSAGVPVIGLGYNQKFAGMFELIDQPDRCLSLAEFVAGNEAAPLLNMLSQCLENPEGFRPMTGDLSNTTASFIGSLVGVPPERLGAPVTGSAA